MRFASAIALLFLALCVTATATAQVVYVDLNAPGPDHDGTSWDTAFLTIQEGVDAATEDGEVWVADGTYVENVRMGRGVAMYGGFLGAEPGGYETELDQRDFENNVTTIDANESGRCVTMGVRSRVDGFEIVRGDSASGGGGFYCGNIEADSAIANNVISSNSAQQGGGIYCYRSSPVITDNTITDNLAQYGGGIYCYDSAPAVTANRIIANSASFGGGIHCDSYSSPAIAENAICENSATYGGGLCCNHAEPNITENTITGNSAGNDGGGLCCQDSSPEVTGNEVSGNSGGDGGGIYCGSSSSPAIADNTICENSAHSGGGIFCWDYSSPTIAHNKISENSAHAAGGIGCRSASAPIISENLINANTARNAGGIWCRDSGPAAVTGNIVIDNVAYEAGGGIHCYNSSPSIAGNTISFNQAWGEYGGGLYCYWYSSPTVTGNGITDNCSTRSGGGIYCGYYSSVTAVGNLISRNSAPDEYGGGLCCGDSSIITGNVFTGNTSNCGGAVSAGGASSVTGNLISGNSAWCGGGLYVYLGSGPVAANTFANNTASYFGGAVYVYESSTKMTNNTITGNWADLRAGGIYCGYYSTPEIANNIVARNSTGGQGGGIYRGSGSPVLHHNDFWANAPDDYFRCDPGESDISADPMFADPHNGDYHLAAASPCTDAGDNDAPGLPEYDWEGDDRIINGVVDIGADEYVTIYAEAPDPQPECDGPLFGGARTGFPAWVWFSIPLTPDCPVGSGCADPNALLGFECDGRLWYWDKYAKSAQVCQPPFLTWDLSVGDSYLLYLEADVTNPSYEGITPFIPWTFEFKLGRMGWTWIGMPGLAEVTGDDFMSSVKVMYPSDETGEHRTAQADYDATPDNWVAWSWAYWNTWLQAPETYTPYAPFGHNTCYPWVGYRVWVKVGAAQSEDDPDQVTLIWPKQ